jgi:pimeloyl-ACP methyl ester carboxylesterase
VTTVIAEDDSLRIVALEGDTDIALVSFSGIGEGLGSLPKEEFRKALSGSKHWQFFVVDKRCTWYTATSADIVRHLSPILGRFRKVVTLGNSMGGYGALLFASRLPNCASAIAFVPQFSMDPRVVPKEKRWRRFTERIEDWPQQHLLQGVPGTLPLHIFFGARERRDGPHIRLFKQHATSGTSIYVLRGAAHDPARRLRDKGLLAATLDAIVVDNAGGTRVRALFFEKSIRYDFWSVTDQSSQRPNGVRALLGKFF